MSVKKNLFIVTLLLVIGGAMYLDMHEIPAPQHPMEKVISNERFIK